VQAPSSIATTVVIPTTLVTPPTDAELYAGDYAQMVRVGKNYSPPFVVCVTGLGDREAAKKPPVIMNEKITELYLQWMQYKFFKENETAFDSVYDLSQKCSKYKYFQHLLKRKGYSNGTSKEPLNIKEKTEFLNQRLEVHQLCLEYLHQVRTPDMHLQYGRAIDAVRQSEGEEIYSHAAPLNKVGDDIDDTVQEMEDHKQAFDKLREVFRNSDVLVHEMAAVKVNFPIAENVENSYKNLKILLEGMKGALEYAIENAEVGQHIRVAIGADVANIIWEKSAAFLVDQGQEVFGKKKYDDPLLNFAFHKYTQAKSEDAFKDIIALVKFIRANVS